MTDLDIKNLHQLQTKNVKHLKQVEKNLRMDINRFLIKGDTFKVSMNTKLYSLLYSSLSEAQFLQILYTPYGFTPAQIIQIKKEKGIANKWTLMLDISLEKFGDVEEGSDLNNKRDKLLSIIEEYIKKPQKMRNKIAHGQWVNAFNGSNKVKDDDISLEINGLNVIDIQKWYEVHQYLCFIIRDLVQSTQLTFEKSYEKNLSKLDEFIIRSSTWTLNDRTRALKLKSHYKKNRL